MQSSRTASRTREGACERRQEQEHPFILLWQAGPRERDTVLCSRAAGSPAADEPWIHLLTGASRQQQQRVARPTQTLLALYTCQLRTACVVADRAGAELEVP